MDEASTLCVVAAWPYCVVAVGIDELQQKALKLLQGRLEGNGQSIQGEGHRLDQLRPQQSVTWGQWERSMNACAYPHISMAVSPYHFQTLS